MAKARAHLYITGRVQGVNFRYYTQQEAEGLGCVGWVRNLRDGRVEVVAEGEQTKVEELARWCHRGPSWASVTNVEIQWETPTGEFKNFGVAYSR